MSRFIRIFAAPVLVAAAVLLATPAHASSILECVFEVKVDAVVDTQPGAMRVKLTPTRAVSSATDHLKYCRKRVNGKQRTVKLATPGKTAELVAAGQSLSVAFQQTDNPGRSSVLEWTVLGKPEGSTSDNSLPVGLWVGGGVALLLLAWLAMRARKGAATT